MKNNPEYSRLTDHFEGFLPLWKPDDGNRLRLHGTGNVPKPFRGSTG